MFQLSRPTLRLFQVLEPTCCKMWQKNSGQDTVLVNRAGDLWKLWMMPNWSNDLKEEKKHEIRRTEGKLYYLVVIIKFFFISKKLIVVFKRGKNIHKNFKLCTSKNYSFGRGFSMRYFFFHLMPAKEKKQIFSFSNQNLG